MNHERKLAAVMFTDIAGYTALMSKDEQKALSTLEKNRTLQKALAEKHSGEFLKEMGDGALLCFKSALDAVRCAMEIQESVTDDPDLNLRIGIHLGDIVFRDGDVFGDGVNVASRIERMAGNGDICISEEVYKSVRNQADVHASFLDETHLKNVDGMVRIYRICRDDEKTNGAPTRSSFRTAGENSIIVLPFVNISPDHDQEYFSDGLTEEIITDLSHIHDLLVISRSSAMTFKGSKKKVTTIAGEVNVRYVLEGSVRKAGNNLRITAQLIDADKDIHLWAEKYSGTLDDVFDIQEKVSRAIAASLKMKLTAEETRKITENPIPDVYAYECFLKARHEVWKWTTGGLDRALDYLEKGLEAAGENAVLLAGMGYVYFQFCNIGIRTDEETVKKAEEYTERALALDPESPNGHIVMGLLRGWSGDPKAGIEHFKRALAVEPNNFDGLVWLPCFYAFMGKKDAAMPHLERLMRVEPHHPMTHFTFAKVHNMDGQFRAALEHLRKALELFPEDHLLRWIFVQTLFYNELNDEAFAVIGQLHEDAPDDVLTAVAWASALGLQGKPKEAAAILNGEAIEALGQNDLGVSFFMGEAYAAAGISERAIDWLENAVDVGFKNYPFLNEYNPLLADLRKEKRFHTFMKRLKKEWEDFEV